MLVWASFSAASRKFSIDHDSGKASDSMLLRTARDLFLMHVVDLDFMIGARSQQRTVSFRNRFTKKRS
ncbi:MAG TPA: hypothetical protein VK776_28320 [Bryobacteraceae bacterium]|nr:hypothetical protein [Bryobacteraceae bacterium]